jgi:hypothetical protein
MDGKIGVRIAWLGVVVPLMNGHAATSFQVTAFGRDGVLAWTNAPVPGICTVLDSTNNAGLWIPGANSFATNPAGRLKVPIQGGMRFYRMLGVDVSATPQGFTNLI